MKIAVKEAGKPLQVVETQEKYRSDAVRVHTDTSKHDGVQFIRLSDDNTFTMGINESGKLFKLPENFRMEFNNPYFPVQQIYGTAVFVRCKYANPYEEVYDFEVEDLTDEDIQFIESVLLRKEEQDRLDKVELPKESFKFFTW